MEGSKVDFHTWYKAMDFMTYSKKKIQGQNFNDSQSILSTIQFGGSFIK
jgi:hypothetical protein